MQTLFTAIYDFFQKRKHIFWICFVSVFFISAIFAIQIDFDDDINKMIAKDDKVEALNNVINKTKVGEQVIFNLSFSDTSYVDPDSIIALQQLLEQQITGKAATYIASFQVRRSDDADHVYQDICYEYLPVFLSNEDYDTIENLIKEDHIHNSLEHRKKLLLSPAGIMLSGQIAKDPIGLGIPALSKFQKLNTLSSYEFYDGYLFDTEKKKLTFFIHPRYPASSTSINSVFFNILDEVLEDWKIEHPEIEVYYFGAPAVAAGNAGQMRNDTILTLSITVVLLLLLTYYVFRRKRAPLLLMLPVVFGAVFGLAITYIVQGSVSIIAIGAGSVILGIAMDFSIHFLSHARSNKDMRENVRSLVYPLTLGAFTTIGAFFILTFAQAPILQDLGIYAASSLMGASLFTLIFLPHLPIHPRKAYLKSEDSSNLIDKLASISPEKNKWLLFLVIAATPILLYYAQKVEFNGDLMQLNYLSPRLALAQEKLNKDNDFALSTAFVVSENKDEGVAAQQLFSIQKVIDQLEAEGKVRSSINPSSILPSRKVQLERIAKWNEFWSPEKKATVLNTVSKSALVLGFGPEAFGAFARLLDKEYQPFDLQTQTLLKDILPGSVSYQDSMHYYIASLKVVPGYRAEVLNAFDANYVTTTDRQSVSEILLAILQQDFDRLLFYSGALVFLALLIAYGRIELALISFLPMVITWIWTLGFMTLFGLQFNVVNIIISTLIFGLGDDYSIFMMDGLMEKYKKGSNKITQSRSAVYLSVITTIVALGALIFAKHPALQSIALTAVIGLLCVVFVSQVLQPFLFNFMIQNRADKGFMPFTLWSLCKSAFSFTYFFIGCIIVTLTGFVLIGLRPLGKIKSKYLFHWILSKYTRSVLYVMTNIRKRVIINDRHVFDKPAVYVANHSSFLDILLTTMLHPKLVLLTANWVWRSPVFGKIVRMADYYPVVNGAEDSLHHLKSIVDQGYGIVVFPEGTRSSTDRINRFHKGAFYIAENLQLDVVPVVIHGAHYAMQKGDWLLKDGITTVEVNDRIPLSDISCGIGYKERAKKMSQWMRERLVLKKQEIETPQYFKEQMIKGSIYKGPVLEWYCRVKIQLENYYEIFHRLLPVEGKIYDLGCGYGFMTCMLYWASEKRSFTGVDYDHDKIETAKNHYKIKEDNALLNDSKRIQFVHATLPDYDLDPCQAIIISDVLHYLTREKQVELLEKSYHALLPGGKLIIRDGVEDLTRRHKVTKLTELFSTKILRFNKTQNSLCFINKSFIQQWAIEKSANLEIIDNKQLSNLIFIIDK